MSSLCCFLAKLSRPLKTAVAHYKATAHILKASALDREWELNTLSPFPTMLYVLARISI